MDGPILYIGLDSSQYSNGEFKEGKTKEICVAIFSSDPRCLDKSKAKERDFKRLDELYNNRCSASMIVDPKKLTGIRPIIYSAEKITEFYLKEIVKENSKIKRLQFYIDGRLHVEEKRHLRDIFGKRYAVTIENYRKRFINCTQPKIVLAADALSNYLFRRRGIELFADLDSRDARIIKVTINGRTLEHYILNP